MSFVSKNPRFRSMILTDLAAGSIANPPSGSHRLINREGTLSVKDSSGLETAIGAGGTVDRITQTAHDFVVGEMLYYTGSNYAKAKADAANTAEIVGMVSRVIDVNSFEITLEGKVTGLSGLVAGSVYFLSASTAGAITATEPNVLGQISLPLGVAISTSAFYVKSSRGAIVGGTNARTEISLSNNASTNTQLVTAYDAGEMTGWVVITGTTSYRFYVAVQFSKNAAGSDYNVSYQTSGETPPAGFSIQYSANYITVTLPNVAGFSSAKLNYALNAPAVGATFPLSISSNNVTFSDIQQASAVSNISFKNSSASLTGSMSSAGIWTFGNAGTVASIAGTRDHVAYGTNKATDSNGNLAILATDALGTDVGAQLTLGGQFNSSTNAAYAFAGIAGRKENATSGNVAGYLSFLSTTSSGTLTEYGRVSSTGSWTLGPAAGSHTLNGQIVVIRNPSSATNAYTSLRLYNDLNNLGRSLEIDYASSTYSGSLLTGGPTGEAAAITCTGGYPLSIGINNQERFRISSAGTINIGRSDTFSSVTGHQSWGEFSFYGNTSNTNVDFRVGYHTGANATLGGFSTSGASNVMGRDSGTNRSLNASGTINASGSDYAEYMTKNGDFVIEKGDICGIDKNGLLTNVYSEAISFVVKSTNPSYVGGDNWFTEEPPVDDSGNFLNTESEEYKLWAKKRDDARKVVDRIAFCGQVPVNVWGANPGDYIVPINDNGAIKGIAVSNPSFEQYMSAIGKVIAINEDGRATIIVKVS